MLLMVKCQKNQRSFNFWWTGNFQGISVWKIENYKKRITNLSSPSPFNSSRFLDLESALVALVAVFISYTFWKPNYYLASLSSFLNTSVKIAPTNTFFPQSYNFNISSKEFSKNNFYN